MSRKNAPAEPAAGGGVHDLIRQREQLRTWIAKLDEVKSDAPSRVAERVRADYEDRLRRVNEDLTGHVEEIERNLESLRADLAVAEERAALAADALEETRLRHMIGELDDEAWDEARPALEGDLSEADGAVERARAEVEQLSALAADIVGAPEPEPEIEPEPEPVAEAGPAFYAPEPAAYDPEPVAEAEPEPAAEDDFAPPRAEENAPAPRAEPDAPQPASDFAPPEYASPGFAASDFASPDVQSSGSAAGGAEPESGEDLAAWISRVEAEVSGRGAAPAEPPAPPPPPPAASAPADEPRSGPLAGADADEWDPFANEFGPGTPTKPGDAADDLPWLDTPAPGKSSGGGGGWTPPAASDGLEFLKELETGKAEGAAAGGGDLADDDLAFLEELDRAISGSVARQPQVPPPAQPSGDVPLPLERTAGAGDPPATGAKSGGRLLCKECGALNEPHSWYCEICGSEL